MSEVSDRAQETKKALIELLRLPLEDLFMLEALVRNTADMARGTGKERPIRVLHRLVSCAMVFVNRKRKETDPNFPAV